MPCSCFYCRYHQIAAPSKFVGANATYICTTQDGKVAVEKHPTFVISTTHGVLITRGKESATLDHTLTGYTDVFTPYHDTTGEWLVMGGKNGVAMLPTSVISASLRAVSAK